MSNTSTVLTDHPLTLERVVGLLELAKAAAVEQEDRITALEAELATERNNFAKVASTSTQAAETFRSEVKLMVSKVAGLFGVDPDDPEAIERSTDVGINLPGGLAKLASDILRRTTPASSGGSSVPPARNTPDGVPHPSSLALWLGNAP